MTTNLERQQARLTELWQRLVHTLGIHTVNVLLDRAIWQAAQHYPELAHIQYSDRGLSFDALNEQQLEHTDDAFNTLYGEMLLILARLLGQDLARRLLEELRAERSPNETDAAF